MMTKGETGAYDFGDTTYFILEVIYQFRVHEGLGLDQISSIHSKVTGPCHFLKAEIQGKNSKDMIYILGYSQAEVASWIQCFMP